MDALENELTALAAIAEDYDGERHSDEACLAAGAHDALRWALGLAEQAVSESIKAE